MDVSITGPSEPTPAQPGGIYLLPEGVTGSAATAWPVFLDWINDFLASSRAADVHAKLAATGASERHAFVGRSRRAHQSRRDPADLDFVVGRRQQP